MQVATKIISYKSRKMLLICFILTQILLYNNKLFSQEGFGHIVAPSHGEIVTLGVNKDNIIYAGAWGDGVYKSVDNGTNWTLVNNGLKSLYITSFAFSKTGTIYITTADSGAFKSTNAGVNWIDINNGLHPRTKTIMCKSSKKTNEPDTLYAGTFGWGIFKSIDAGATWKAMNTGVTNFDINTLIITKEDVILAGSQGNGILRSTDGANTWVKNNSNVASNFINAFYFKADSSLAVATNGKGLYETAQAGVSWSQVGDNADKSLIDYNITCIVYPNAKAGVSQPEPVVGTRNAGIRFYDTPHFDKWMNSNIQTGGVNALARTSNGTLFAALPGRGILKSTNNGEFWDDVNSLLFDKRGNKKYRVAAGSDGMVCVSPNNGGLFVSNNYCKTWSVDKFPSIVPSDLIAFDRTIMFAEPSGGIQMSTDSGATFTKVGPTDKVISMAVHPIDRSIRYCLVGLPSTGQLGDYTKVVVYRSADAGQTWQAKSGQILALHTSKLTVNTSDHVYLFLDGFQQSANPPIYKQRMQRSTDQGLTFQVTNYDVSMGSFNSLVSDKNGMVYAAGDDGLFTFNNGSLTYTKLNLDLPASTQPYISCLAVRSPNEFYAGYVDDKGVARTTNGAVSWDTLNYSYNVSPTTSIAVGSDGDIYFVSAGVHKLMNPEEMAIPQLKTPIKDATNVAYHPTLTWKPTDEAELYLVQLSLDEEFLDLTEYGTIGDTNRYVLTNLQPNKTYYWRVAAKSYGALSNWSEVRSFTTQIVAPILISPDTNKRGVALKPSFKWYKPEAATKFNIRVATDTSFAAASIVFSKNDIVDSTIVSTTLLNPITEYWWQVQASNKTSTSLWSKMRKFRTKVGIPKLTLPINKATFVDVDATFKWDTTKEASAYYIEVSKTSDFQTSIFLGQALNLNSTNVLNLEYNQTYYWRVYAANDDAEGDWSEVWSFTTGIGAPSLIEPADKSKNLAKNINFLWTKVKAASAYNIQICKDTSFAGAGLVLDVDTISTTNINISTLARVSSFYWRIRPKLTAEFGPWSERFFFKTGMDKPLLKTPTDKTQEIDTMYVDCYWYDTEGAKSYEIEYDININMTNPQKYTTDNFAEKRYANLKANTTYYWRVLAVNDDGKSEYSDIWSFKTKSYSSVEMLLDKEVEIYPNPASNQINLNLDLKEVSNVVLNIFDIKGTNLMIQNMKMLDSSPQSINLNVSNLANGTYFLEITINNEKLLKEIKIVK